MRLRRITGIALMVIGFCPTVAWLGYAGYMFYLGPRIGWLSDEFLDVEGQSLLCLMAAFIGIGVACFGGTVVMPDDVEPGGRNAEHL